MANTKTVNNSVKNQLIDFEIDVSDILVILNVGAELIENFVNYDNKNNL